MNLLGDIGDEEFVPFLHGLGVETCKKSFEWMLNDQNFAGILRWLFNSLDHNNALSAREEYRIQEINKDGHPTPENLELSIASIKEQYPAICLPGDQEAKEDMKLQINMLQEKLKVLEKHNSIAKDLMMQNELIKEKLMLEISQRSCPYQQLTEDESTAAEQCTTLARELETITDDVLYVIGENLEVYACCKNDKEVAKRFLTFSPLESYRQSQALFRSHFDLFVSKYLVNRQNDTANEDLRSALVEAKVLEERLSKAALAFLITQADLCGEQAIMTLVTKYKDVHPSQITSCFLEAQSALDLLEQEENLVEQQVQNTVEEFVKNRTDLAVATATAAAFNVRLQIDHSLSHLIEVWQRAHALDKLLYFALRHELRTLDEFVQFASQLRQYALDETSAVAGRIDAINEICNEHENCLSDIQSKDKLLQLLFSMLCKSPTNDATMLVKLHKDFGARIKELRESVADGFRKKENDLVEFKTSTQRIHNYIWSGCTKQANCWDKTVASLTRTLKDELDNTDLLVGEASSKFTQLKNGDKKNLRKLWQWFLTDPKKLMMEMKKVGRV